jgi:hypothetical protein
MGNEQPLRRIFCFFRISRSLYRDPSNNEQNRMCGQMAHVPNNIVEGRVRDEIGLVNFDKLD